MGWILRWLPGAFVAFFVKRPAVRQDTAKKS